MRWSDLLRVDRDAITPAGAVAMTRWLRRQFADNRPYDALVRDIVTARGSITDEGPAAIYKALTTPEDLSRSFSQLFLGIRIQCAQCHHHPSDRWGQEDYFALAGFFTGIGRKRLPGGGEAIFAQKGSELRHPRTGKPVPAQALGAAPGRLQPARPIAARCWPSWMTAADNPFFARAIANRLWSHYFGRGLVEPLDDMRATNPATNEPLLDELAKHMRDVKYDLKAFTRTLLNSRLYQLAGFQDDQGRQDGCGRASTSRTSRTPCRRAIPAEVLLDAISQATGVAGEVQRLARRLSGDPGLGQPHAVVLLPHLRPAGPGQRLRMRTQQRAEHRPGPAPDELRRNHGQDPLPPGHRPAAGSRRR